MATQLAGYEPLAGQRLVILSRQPQCRQSSRVTASRHPMAGYPRSHLSHLRSWVIRLPACR
jgi:hypothetical protein